MVDSFVGRLIPEPMLTTCLIGQEGPGLVSVRTDSSACAKAEIVVSSPA